MGKYQLRITLLSDMCVSDGGVYNSSLDMDICHDELGFPYIPAKRLKGCLRECALELNDWGKEIPVSVLFGSEGSRAAALRLGNAYPENYMQMRADVLAHRNTLVCHPQNVLNHFSYIRTQTAIDYHTGIAEPASLRTMRVANQGQTDYIAKAELDDAYYDALQDCCRIFSHMGVSRTRGLGEVRAVLEKTEPETDRSLLHKPWKEGADCLVYTLSLEESMICKSVNGGESRTMDYIEGGKMLGLIAGLLRKKGDSLEALTGKGELFCSNAYIEQDGIRMLEVPASCFEIKNDDTHYIDKIFETEQLRETEQRKGHQLSQMKHCYTAPVSDGKLLTCDVDMEERYHHRRPSDKSIGRAFDNGSGESTFYQMQSIMAGQRFQGYIWGSTEQIRKIYQCLAEREEYYLGYSRSAEYGKVKLHITDVCKKEIARLKGCREFAVKLEAPAVIYNDRAMYSVDAEDLVKEVNTALGIREAEPAAKYINEAVLGGYNVTWNARKPVIGAFDKGTVLHYRLKEAVDLPAFFLLGERVAEGYGEASVICPVSESACYEGEIADAAKTDAGSGLDVQNSNILRKISDELFFKYIRTQAGQAAKKLNLDKKEAIKPTVSNMILLCKENGRIEDIEKAVFKRFEKRTDKKNSKLEEAKSIIGEVRKNVENLADDFAARYQIAAYSYDRDVYECRYMEAYLLALKYRIRQQEQEEMTKKGEQAHES